MKKTNSLPAFLIIGIAGTLWHFIYEWSNYNAVIGAIAPINESTWEHLKMLFFPSLIYFAVEYIILKEKPENYIAAASVGIFAGMLSIITLFYTYSGILGFNVTAVDIAIYFISLAVTVALKSVIIIKNKFCSKAARAVSLYFIIHIAVLFVWWSFYPPNIGIFQPPEK